MSEQQPRFTYMTISPDKGYILNIEVGDTLTRYVLTREQLYSLNKGTAEVLRDIKHNEQLTLKL